MNRLFHYEHMELWEDRAWEGRLSPISGLVEAIGRHRPVTEGICLPKDIQIEEKPETSLDYRQKTGSVEAQAVLDELKKNDLHYESKELGGTLWATVFPEKAEEETKKQYPVLAVFVREIRKDRYWSMRLLTEYQGYIAMAKKQRWALLFVVTEEPCADRMYVSIFQEAVSMYPFDMNQMWLDVSVLMEKNLKLSAVSGFRYTDREGKAVADPDRCIEVKFGIPMLDISFRWAEEDSLNRGMVMNSLMNSGFDPQRLIHSRSGLRLMDGIYLEYRFGSILEPELKAYWKKRGADLDIHELKGERWVSLAPGDPKPGKKLPVIAVFSEVCASNPHAPVTALATFYELAKLAAEGEAVLTFFALEDPEANELYCDILEELSKSFPVDMDRVYVTGHSHNAHFAFTFARRHPELVAAAATAGIPCSLMDYAGSGIRNFSMEEEEVEELSRYDLPVINVSGCLEGLNLFPVTDDNYKLQNDFVWSVTDFKTRVRYWQRRLKASRCPILSEEEIAAASASRDKATRMLGIPNDRSFTVYGDGYEHYVADIKNSEGRFHLRIVGIEDMIHMTTPFMQELEWNFLRQFARDRKTMKIRELV